MPQYNKTCTLEFTGSGTSNIVVPVSYTHLNPVIIESSGEQEGLEGCLSCPGEWGMTKRPNYVKVKAF